MIRGDIFKTWKLSLFLSVFFMDMMVKTKPNWDQKKLIMDVSWYGSTCYKCISRSEKTISDDETSPSRWSNPASMKPSTHSPWNLPSFAWYHKLTQRWKFWTKFSSSTLPQGQPLLCCSPKLIIFSFGRTKKLLFVGRQDLYSHQSKHSFNNFGLWRCRRTTT